MTMICALRRTKANETIGLPSAVQDRERELVMIIAEAELAFEKVCRGPAEMAA